jgi:hypothetical protein
VPHFIQDDKVEEVSGLNSNFKLSLQAAVCHRGNSVDSGHYVALVRGTAVPGSPTREYSHTTKIWMRFDDLAPHRITVIDIEKALKEETPYLLFYQIVPIEGDPGSITAGEASLSTVHERNASASEVSDISVLTDNASISGRPSFEINVRDEPRGRSPAETKRASVISFQDPPPETASGANETSLKVPSNDDQTSTPRPKSLSRSQSKTSDGGGSLGRTLSKLRRKSREALPPPMDTTIKPLAEAHPTGPSEQPRVEPQVAKSQAQVVPQNHAYTASKSAALQAPHQPPKTHKRDKSRGRTSRSRGRGEKPDRECIVM